MKHLKCRMDLLKSLALLSDEECARFVRGAVRYAEKGTAPELIGREADLWDQAQADIDRQAEEYGKRVVSINEARNVNQKNRTDISTDISTDNRSDIRSDIRSDNSTDNRSDNSCEKKEAKRFVPPTVEEVEEYCNSNGYWVDAQQFCDFYEAKGWMVGSNKMKDWRAAVRNWNKREQERRRERRNAPGQQSGVETLLEMVRNGEI